MPAKSCAIFLVRHGLAGERGDDYPDDSLRPLTTKGIARMRDNVAGLRALGVEIDLVLASPFVRAKQTADILAEGLRPSPEVQLTPALTPDSSPALAVQAIGSRDGVRALALVGHEPSIGQIAAWLIGAKMPLQFKKGGVCRIDVPRLPPNGSGELVWHATPRMLRGLA